MSNQPDKTQLPAKTAERPVDLKGLINSPAIREQVARALPRHLTADRFLRVATTTLLRVPKLAQCTQASFMRAMLDCSSLGLEPDGRRAHLIPYGQECQLIIDYKGLIELAKRSGDVASWKAETVKERDEFEWENGNVTHKINWREDRGALQCVYSIVHLKDGDVDTEVMTLKEVEAIRKRSRAGNSGPWVTDFEEMAKKGLALDTLIPTPYGWTTMEALQVGDAVFDMHGEVTQVIAVSEIKSLPCFRISFTNGDSIVCDDEHRWIARCGLGNAHRDEYAPMTVNELLERFNAGESITVPVAESLQLGVLLLPIDPYLLGLWLGDGSSWHATITSSKEDADHVRQSILEAGYKLGKEYVDPRTGVVSTRACSGFFRDLNAAGVIRNKHVPSEYLRGSIEQRIALLQGLMDSDGHLDKARGRAHFYNTNPVLAAAVCELVRSLGDVPHTAVKTMRGFDTECTAYYVGWKPSFPCVRLPRKLANYRPRKIAAYRGVSLIEKIESVPTKCIAVASATKTYLCGESMIPTHNTVIRRHSKRLTLSPEFSDALDRDADSIPFDEIAEGGSKKNTRYQAGRFQPPQIDATEVIDEGDAQPQSEPADNEAAAPAEQQQQVAETKQAPATKAKPAFQPKTQSPAARTAKPVQQQPEPEPTSEPEEDPDQNGDGDDNLFGEA